MKYTTFRNLIVLGGLGAAVGSMYMCLRPGAVHVSPTPAVVSSSSQGASAPESPRPLPAQAASAAQAPVPAAALAPTAPTAKRADAPTGGEALRPLDDEVLRLAGQRMTTDKVKDAVPGRPYKINLYVEGGRVVRAKVDLNRNEKWDEKWSFDIEGGTPVVKRQVSPTDDDSSYPLKYRLAGKAWVKE
ncbi:MAG: hypothetical protein U1A78_20005 [Polyangia bacterium]